MKTFVQESAYGSPAWISAGPVRTGTATGQVTPRAAGAHTPAKAANNAAPTIEGESRDLVPILL